MKDMKKFLLLAAFALSSAVSFAQKKVYIPNEWRNPWPSDSLLYAENDPNNKYTWSKSRSVETDNFIIFWDKGWGSTAPDKLSKSNFYYFDLDFMKQKLEEYYDLEINQLGFVDPVNSNVAKYKIMVLLNHTEEWTCYGGGYDFQVPALWLNPATSKPVGSAVAHEVGHSFHYMCYAEDSRQGTIGNCYTGFHGAVGMGAAIWETTANWQALQSFPDEYFTMSGTSDIFQNSHNYAFTHEWHRYQAYPFFTYLVEHYGDVKVISDVWKTHETTIKDFNEVLMDCKGLSVEELYNLHFDFAMHVVTWDIASAKPYLNDSFIGKFHYACSQMDDKTYQVAYESCPQGTGFNVIPLQVPAAGTDINTHFTALRTASNLTEADPARFLNGDSRFENVSRTKDNAVSRASQRGFRLGYVALMNDGSRQYFTDNKIHCTGSAETTEDYGITVPEGVKRLWLVVAPALKSYFQHQWDDVTTNDDQWPYRFQLEGTDLGSAATVYASPTLDGRKIQDATLTYDVYFAPRNDYIGATVTVGGSAAATLGTAFQMKPSDIAGKMVNYTSAGPANGKVMFYAAKSDGSLIQSGSTANGYGHWFSKTGGVVSYGNTSYVYSEFQPNTLSFNLGAYPNRTKNGDTYTIAQALRYRSGSDYAKVVFVFNIHIDSSRTGAELASIDYENTDAISMLSDASHAHERVDVYSLSGVKVKGNVERRTALDGLQKGIYLVGDEKVMVK